MKLYKHSLLHILLIISFLSCSIKPKHEEKSEDSKEGIYLYVLGNLQDAGAPQMACTKEHCQENHELYPPPHFVSCLAVVDREEEQQFIFDASPDLAKQWDYLCKNEISMPSEPNQPSGIFLTHAHIGHYTGLMHLGKEAMSARSVPVYAMPRMDSFLRGNGPWSQLVDMNQIDIRPIQHDSLIRANKNLKVRPFLVPHRDEFSETVGFEILGPSKTALFIPDIDKWSKWNVSLIEEVKRVDYLFIDATFYSDDELPGRNMAEIPHPFVLESMELLKDLPKEDKAKVYFTHLNHTNPLRNKQSKAYKEVIGKGFKVAQIGDRIRL